ncbi:MAG TPA: DUF4007 family protein [Pyrinomonadaceae bacterium]|nr:DUF4007 family protein [Pyrinomonadaceae bacterium]
MYPATSSKSNFTVSFSGHETFPFRYGWLKKGIDAVTQDPTLFASEQAMAKMGVGKNMVRSIRHWCLAAGLIREESRAGAVRGQLTATALGKKLLFDNGFDPYLEDPATLWLIHWQITSNISAATTWFWAFNYWNVAEFTKEVFISELRAWLANGPYKQVAENSLKRDADCFVRTYVQSRYHRGPVSEDTLDCPLVDLHLLAELADGKTYQFQRGGQPSLPDEIFIYSLIEFWRASGQMGNTLAFEKIAYEAGSPGRIFKLNEDSLSDRLERIETISNGLYGYDETSGLKQIYKRSEAELEPMELLKTYYRKSKAVKTRAA